MVEPSKAPLMDGKYRKDKLLGRGGYGVVFLYEDVVDHRWVAIKSISYEGWTERDEKLVEKEVATLL